MLRLRSEGHALIAADIGDERKRRGDSLLLAIAGAVLCESRVSEASVVDAHVRGVMALLKERGGVGSLVDKPWHCGITYVLLLPRGGGRGRGLRGCVEDEKELVRSAGLACEIAEDFEERELELPAVDAGA